MFIHRIIAKSKSLYQAHIVGGNPNNNTFCNKRISVKGPHGTAVVAILDRCGSCKGVSDLSSWNIITRNEFCLIIDIFSCVK